MMRVLARWLVGATVGFVAGVVLGLAWYCYLTPSPSNLCGIIALIKGGPAGAVLGAIVGAVSAAGRK